MKLFPRVSWIAPLIYMIVLTGCTEAGDPESTVEVEAGVTTEPTSEGEEEILLERTPVPTATPDPITLAITEAAASAGLTDQTVLGLTVDDWIDVGVSILIVVGGYALGSLLVRVLLPRLSRRVPAPYNQEINKYFGAKLRQLILLYLLRLATVRLLFMGIGLKNTLLDIYFAIGLVVLTQMGLKTIDLIAGYYVERLEPPERQAELAPIAELLGRLGYVIVIVLAVSFGLARFGINIAALAAAMGIAGLGFALAAQDTIADMIAGMLILADRPFRVGDRIEIESIKTWGDVMEIGLRTTRIRTRDNRVVIVPNSTISKNEVINYSYPDPMYRIETHVGIAYGADIEQAREIMVDTVSKVEGVLQDKPIEALYIEMADSEMRFRVRWWIDSYVDTRRMFDKVHTAIQNALNEAGFEDTYPIRELHHRLTLDQEEDLQESLTIRETRRKPKTSNPPSDDGGSDRPEPAEGTG